MALKGFYKPLSGIFGKLNVLKYQEHQKNCAYFLCKCECGTEVVVSGVRLRNGKTKSCGCLTYNNLLGKKFGKLIVIERSGTDSKGKPLWKCQCDCEKQTIVRSQNLITGITKSCGCSNPNKTQQSINMIDEVSGHLRVISYAGTNKYQSAMWNCMCNRCGNTKIVSGRHIRKEMIRSCGCLVGSKSFRKYTYDKNTYRSALDLLFVFILEKLHIDFVYEPKHFKINFQGSIVTYTPDFYLPGFELWIEIKMSENNSKFASPVDKFYEFAKTYKSKLVTKSILQTMLNMPMDKVYKLWRLKQYDPKFGKSFILNHVDFNFLF